MNELKAEYPNARIVREEGFVDIVVQTPGKLLLFEIKSDLDPKAVIRHALGQILEYAYYPSRQQSLPVKLVIVGRCPLSPADYNYLNCLKTNFNLPIDYRVVSL